MAGIDVLPFTLSRRHLGSQIVQESRRLNLQNRPSTRILRLLRPDRLAGRFHQLRQLLVARLDAEFLAPVSQNAIAIKLRDE
jgi:hypothetical protein